MGHRCHGVEHADVSGFVAVAFFAINRLRDGERLRCAANGLDLSAQS